MEITICVVCKRVSENLRYVELGKCKDATIYICEECAHDVIETFEQWDG